MTETKRLYYEDVYKKEFTAKVLECREAKKGFHIILDESAFYPEGGGQPSDAGYLNDVKVKEVHEKDGDHLDTDTLTEFFYGKKLQHADLSGMCHMSSTACTDIHPWKFNNTNLTGEFFFASVINFFQFFSCRI